MWGLFGKPTCPISAEMQEWVDARFWWLQQQFGIDAPYKARVILPTPEFFPDPYSGKSDDVQAMFNRVAGYMDLDPGLFELYFFNRTDRATMEGFMDGPLPGIAGLYHGPVTEESATPLVRERRRIGLSATTLDDPMSVVAVLAHELGHEILLGQNRIARDTQDSEPLTDLITVFLGLGIFTANATIRDRGWRSGGWSGWRTSQLGYLDQSTFSYALAQFARVRGETNPAWMKHLRADVRALMKQSMRYLANNP
jgi:hypothetical protein